MAEGQGTIVYVLKSNADPTRYYTGLTSALAGRLDAHNAGRVPHTASSKPWIIDVILSSPMNGARLRLRSI